MRRPGTAGSLILLAFIAVFAVEFNTLLQMVGIHVDSGVYFPLVGLGLLTLLVVLLFLSDGRKKEPAIV